MPLSDEDKRRIEEEEYRKHVQSRLQDTRRVDVNLKTEQRIETHGVGRQIYNDVTEGVEQAMGIWLRAMLWGSVVVLVLMGGFFAVVFLLRLFGWPSTGHA